MMSALLWWQGEALVKAMLEKVLVVQISQAARARV